jgi:hypothetical protein
VRERERERATRMTSVLKSKNSSMQSIEEGDSCKCSDSETVSHCFSKGTNTRYKKQYPTRQEQRECVWKKRRSGIRERTLTPIDQMLNAAETRLGAVNTIANKNRPPRRNILTMKRPPAGCQERRGVGEAPRVRRRSEQLRVPLSSSSSHEKKTSQTWTANWRNKRRDKRRSCLSTVCAIDFNGKKNIQSNTRNGKGSNMKTATERHLRRIERTTHK